MQNLEPQDRDLSNLVKWLERGHQDDYAVMAPEVRRPLNNQLSRNDRDEVLKWSLERLDQLDLAAQEPAVYLDVIRRLDNVTGRSHPSLEGLRRAGRQQTTKDAIERQRLHERAVARDKMNVLPFMSGLVDMRGGVKIFPSDSGKRDIPSYMQINK